MDSHQAYNQYNNIEQHGMNEKNELKPQYDRGILQTDKLG